MEINPQSNYFNSSLKEITGGFFPAEGQHGRVICNLDPWDTTRRDMLVLLLRKVISENIVGGFAELGVWRGSTARLIHHYAPDRTLHLFDTFEGFTERGAALEKLRTGHSVAASGFGDTSLELARRRIEPNDNVYFHVGYFPDSVPESVKGQQFAFVHLDADLFEPTMAGLEFFYPRMSVGGLIVVHDFNAWAGARKAVDEFCEKRIYIPMPDKNGSVVIVKSEA